MLKKFRRNFIRIYFQTVQSIAFIPALISIIMTVLAFIAISFHQTEISESLTEAFPWLRMRSASLASSILTTLLAGTISLTVFSFSMVMVVLNQAASNYTPKILNQIAQDKHNQFVLGFYIGSMLFFIVLLMNFTKEDDELKVPNLAFFLAIVFGVIIILLFVNFINHITVSIQVKKILQMLYSKTKAELNEIMPKRADTVESAQQKVLEENTWHPYVSQSSGYFQSVMPGISSYLKEKEFVIKMDIRFGDYILKGNPLFSANKEIDEELQAEVQSYLAFFTEERIDNNYFYGLRQITEIAIKALSPSVNDPGTAVICIDFLADLISIRAQVQDIDYQCDSDGEIRVIEKIIPFEEVLFNIFTPIRNYGKTDYSILRRLMLSLEKLGFIDRKNKKFDKIYNAFAQAIIQNADENLKNQMDRDYFNKIIEQLNAIPENYFRLNLINRLTINNPQNKTSFG